MTLKVCVGLTLRPLPKPAAKLLPLDKSTVGEEQAAAWAEPVQTHHTF